MGVTAIGAGAFAAHGGGTVQGAAPAAGRDGCGPGDGGLRDPGAVAGGASLAAVQPRRLRLVFGVLVRLGARRAAARRRPDATQETEGTTQAGEAGHGCAPAPVVGHEDAPPDAGDDPAGRVR